MNPKAHTEKVAGEATKKKSDSPFRCGNCGATFVLESKQQAHEQSQYGESGSAWSATADSRCSWAGSPRW